MSGGVAELADRPVDPRRVARWMAAFGLLAALGLLASAERLLATADLEPEAGRTLRRLERDGPAPAPGAPGRLVVLLIDGLRRDEAARLSSWRRLAPEAVTGELALDAPTLSRPFHHSLFTGVPADVSGVRSNRFTGPARHDSVMDRVRAAGGAVTIHAEGLDWMRRMHGPAEGGDEAIPEALGVQGGEVEGAPGLLVVHLTAVDRTAHEEGLESEAHRAALRAADETLARLAALEGVALVALSDHGHVDGGGHGGLEPEVARAPLLVRAPGLAPRALEAPVPTAALAPALSAWLGVPRPRSATRAAPPALLAAPIDDDGLLRHASVVSSGVTLERARLSQRRRLGLLLVLVLSFAALGPIKRAFGFDRSVLPGLLLWPALLLGIHLALGRPLSLSAIDTQARHVIRVVLLGAGCAVLACALLFPLARGRLRLARVAAVVGWSQLAAASGALAWVGLALGPWPLGSVGRYLALLFAGAASAGLPVVAAALLTATTDRAR